MINAMVAMMLTTSGLGAAPAPRTPVPSVRALSDCARVTLADARRRSATVARLVAELQRADMIVLIDTRADPALPTGRTILIGTAAGVRFVHVLLNSMMSVYDRIEYLGHELQHAVEIAEDPLAVDGPSLRRRFAAIGWEPPDSTRYRPTFETDGARLVSLQIRRELSNPPKAASGRR